MTVTAQDPLKGQNIARSSNRHYSGFAAAWPPHYRTVEGALAFVTERLKAAPDLSGPTICLPDHSGTGLIGQ
jgi:hypothetical protein